MLNNTSKEPIVIFDLDGTITKYDTYKIFLFLGLKKNPSKWIYLPELLIAALKNKAGYLGNAELKELFLNKIYKNSTQEKIIEISSDLAKIILRKGLRKSALEKIDWHRQSGARLILATASLDVYARTIANRIGIDEVIATKCGVTPDGSLSGYLDGKNLKSFDKVLAIQEFLGHQLNEAITIAYSDHHSDLPLLLAVKSGIAVNPTPQLLKEAILNNLIVENWNT